MIFTPEQYRVWSNWPQCQRCKDWQKLGLSAYCPQCDKARLEAIMSEEGDEYRTVTVTMQQLRVNSIMVTVPRMQGWQSIARSLIHGGDDRILLQFQHSCPVAITIRIFAWKADELHLAS